MIRPLTYALFLGTTALCAAPARAGTHALIVGVSDYLVLDADLKGPSYDAALMAETLVARGVDPAAMTVLASDPSGAPQGAATGAPTRAEILAAMQALDRAAQPGDTVVFYFSGHGSQAPMPVAMRAGAMTRSCCPPMPRAGRGPSVRSTTRFWTMSCRPGRRG